MFFHRLRELRRLNLDRSIKDRSSAQGPRIIIEDREFINFSSNDYLGLAGHPEITRAASDAMQRFGFGGGASRLLAGGSELHTILERKIASLKSTDSALVFNSGYAANTGIIPAIAGEGDVIFSDELNHASIVDGCRLSKAKTVLYDHRDMDHLKKLLTEPFAESRQRVVIVTDAVFSMDGDIAPLRTMYDLCLNLNSERRHKDPALLYVDDAHGTGVLGKGKGTLAYFGISPEPWIIQMGTLSKALGSFGAFVAGSREVIEWLTNTARSFIFSTAIPACAVAAASKAIDLMKTRPELIQRLWRNRIRTADMLRGKGYDIGKSETPIIPLMVNSVEDALKLSRHLYEKGIYAPAIRPPTVKTPRVRITVTAAHSEEDIAMLSKALSSCQV
jgi:8-amino-7-oxononanoate synthase